jgi:hypothetical protein
LQGTDCSGTLAHCRRASSLVFCTPKRCIRSFQLPNLPILLLVSQTPELTPEFVIWVVIPVYSSVGLALQNGQLSAVCTQAYLVLSGVPPTGDGLESEETAVAYVGQVVEIKYFEGAGSHWELTRNIVVRKIDL